MGVIERKELEKAKAELLALLGDKQTLDEVKEILSAGMTAQCVKSVQMLYAACKKTTTFTISEVDVSKTVVILSGANGVGGASLASETSVKVTMTSEYGSGVGTSIAIIEFY